VVVERKAVSAQLVLTLAGREQRDQDTHVRATDKVCASMTDMARVAIAPLWARRQQVRPCADAMDKPSARSSDRATGKVDSGAEPQERYGCDSEATAVQRGCGDTNGGSVR